MGSMMAPGEDDHTLDVHYDRKTFAQELAFAVNGMTIGKKAGNWAEFCKDACADGRGPEITAALSKLTAKLKEAS